ncbi:MAG: DUF732 domain-containing protein [Mycobacterium sp.]|nr:MAG: DUF732 domain-containing protein [Mycobacterium sp.]
MIRSFGAAVLAAGLVLAAPVHADDVSFLDVVGPGPYGAPAQLGLGRYVCDQLHGGTPVEAVHGPTPWTPASPELITAAQHELCPDTLAG